MVKPKRTKPAAAAAASKEPQGPGVLRRAMPHVVGAGMLLAGVVLVTVITRGYVQDHQPPGGQWLDVELMNKPVWMSESLARQIVSNLPRTAGGGSVFDRDLLIKSERSLKQSPWVANVRSIRRVYGQVPGDTLQVDCEFRTPVALVRRADQYWLVDSDGVRLSDAFDAADVPQIVTGRNGHVNIRIIEGVHQPPPNAGQLWVGQDLAAGVGLLKLLNGKPYLEQVTAVDVGNFGGRISRRDPQLVMKTKFASEVWWGRPVNAKDYFIETKVDIKLQTLTLAFEQTGRVDAGRQCLDIRFDDVYEVLKNPANGGPVLAGERSTDAGR